MTDEQAEELLKNNDWAKFSDARELLMEAAHMGAMAERKTLEAEMRRLQARLAASEDQAERAVAGCERLRAQRDLLLKALERAEPLLIGPILLQARAAIKAVEEGK